MHFVAEAHRGGLQEVAVARGALGIKLEVFHAPVLQNDELDVLSAHVADNISMRIKVQRGLQYAPRFQPWRRRR